MTDYTLQIHSYLEQEKQALDTLSTEEINTVLNVLEQAKQDGRIIYICGNGGSASTAAHFECDFSWGSSCGYKTGFRVEYLGDNMVTLMAIANDIGYENIFVVPLQSRLRRGDVVIGISGSGNSENVVRAIQYANEIGAETISFTGFDGGRLRKTAKYSIHLNVDRIQIVEDVHLILNHLMISVLQQFI